MAGKLINTHLLHVYVMLKTIKKHSDGISGYKVQVEMGRLGLKLAAAANYGLIKQLETKRLIARRLTETQYPKRTYISKLCTITAEGARYLMELENQIKLTLAL